MAEGRTCPSKPAAGRGGGTSRCNTVDYRPLRDTALTHRKVQLIKARWWVTLSSLLQMMLNPLESTRLLMDERCAVAWRKNATSLRLHALRCTCCWRLWLLSIDDSFVYSKLTICVYENRWSPSRCLASLHTVWYGTIPSDFTISATLVFLF